MTPRRECRSTTGNATRGKDHLQSVCVVEDVVEEEENISNAFFFITIIITFLWLTTSIPRLRFFGRQARLQLWKRQFPDSLHSFRKFTSRAIRRLTMSTRSLRAAFVKVLCSRDLRIKSYVIVIVSSSPANEVEKFYLRHVTRQTFVQSPEVRSLLIKLFLRPFKNLEIRHR